MKSTTLNNHISELMEIKRGAQNKMNELLMRPTFNPFAEVDANELNGYRLKLQEVEKDLDFFMAIDREFIKSRKEDQKCNGWTNFETWKVNLELVHEDGYGEDIKAGVYEDVDDLADAIESGVSELAYYDVPADSFACSAVTALLSEVNWYEIADQLWEAYYEEDEDENEFRR